MCNQNTNNGSIRLEPVGIIRNASRLEDWEEGFSNLSWKEKAALMKQHRSGISEIMVDERLEGILDGIEEFSHLEIFFWPHQVPEGKRSLTRVHPLGNTGFPLTGIFATRSPVRPNPILVTTVRLLERCGNILKVTGLDALDGSPLLDIKPFNSARKVEGEVRLPDWMKQVGRGFANPQS